jgi:hypothetical protein
MHVSILFISARVSTRGAEGSSTKLQRAYLFTCQLRLFPVACSLACLRHQYPTPYSLYTQVSTDIVLLCHLLYPHYTQPGQDPKTRHITTKYLIFITTTTSIQVSLRQRDLDLIKYRRDRHYNTYERRVCLRSSTEYLDDHKSVTNDTTYTIYSTYSLYLSHSPARRHDRP